MGMIKGQKEYQRFKEGKSLTRKAAMLAMCYMCNGEESSNVDCQGSKSYPMYPYSPYGKQIKPASGKRSFYGVSAVKKTIMPTVIIMFLLCIPSYAQETVLYSSEAIAQAIFWAEGGYKTKHPYGILKKYKHTTPKQACVNTINHAKRDFTGDPGDFISFLGSRYCPVGSNTDNGTCKYWVKNVTYFLKKGAK